QADLNAGTDIVNTAAGHATFGANAVNSATDTATVHITQSPALTIAKTVATTSNGTYFKAVTVNATVPGSYHYLVTNLGNVRLSGPVTVTDDTVATVTCPAVSSVGNLDAFLDPGEAVVCTGSYSVTQADLNAGTDIVNTAAGHATFGANAVNSATDTATVHITQSPALPIPQSVATRRSSDLFKAVTVNA